MVHEEGDAENVSRDCMLFYVLLQGGHMKKPQDPRLTAFPGIIRTRPARPRWKRCGGRNNDSVPSLRLM